MVLEPFWSGHSLYTLVNLVSNFLEETISIFVIMHPLKKFGNLRPLSNFEEKRRISWVQSDLKCGIHFGVRSEIG